MSVFYEIIAAKFCVELECATTKDAVVLGLVQGGHDHVRVVKWVRCSDGRDRSCAMQVYEHGVERGVYIHG
jgi:hypothetical protein